MTCLSASALLLGERSYAVTEILGEDISRSEGSGPLFSKRRRSLDVEEERNGSEEHGLNVGCLGLYPLSSGLSMEAD